MSDLTAVEQANAGFYQAFETLDIARMELRLVARRARAVRPPGLAPPGRLGAVRTSWATIFENTAEMRFSLSDVRASAIGDLAWVTCTENIFSEVHGRLAVTSVLATNLFERTADGWRLIHHHASHVFSATPESDSTNN